MELFQQKKPDLQKSNEKNIYFCKWDQVVDNKKICVNINSDLCGKKCSIKELKCDFCEKPGQHKIKNEKPN